jgi:hypothetical protein
MTDHRHTALNLVGPAEYPPPAATDVEALVHAVVYVGDQLATIAQTPGGNVRVAVWPCPSVVPCETSRWEAR